MKKGSLVKARKSLSRFWNWIWNSDSIMSYVIFLIVIFVLMKYLLIPVFGFVMGAELPIAIVESSSMDHGFVKSCVLQDVETGACKQWSQYYSICGEKSEDRLQLRLDEYWDTCGGWYENNGITKEQFQDFSLKNGFKKGDILVLTGWGGYEIGDVILFYPNQGSTARHPIIHRLISENPLQTKGDHNQGQLTPSNNIHKTDETNIQENQVIGVARFKIPYLGWVKLFFVELWQKSKLFFALVVVGIPLFIMAVINIFNKLKKDGKGLKSKKNIK